MRQFAVAEQVVEDPATKLRFEFSSVHTDELKAGNEAPNTDHIVIMRMWTSDRTRMAEFKFERSGMFLMADVHYLEPGDGPSPDGQPPDGQPPEVQPPAVDNTGDYHLPPADEGMGTPVDEPVKADTARIIEEDPELAKQLGLVRQDAVT